jgi:hypothetical protein
VRFNRLAASQIEPFSYENGVAPLIDGSDPLLAPNTALHIGLALHELAANSANFGVLRDGAGTIRVTARPVDSGSRIEWLEEPERPVTPVATWGFGRTVLRHVVPRALGSEAEFEVRPEAIRYAIDVPDRIDIKPEGFDGGRLAIRSGLEARPIRYRAAACPWACCPGHRSPASTAGYPIGGAPRPAGR